METLAPHAQLTNRDKTLFRLVDANIIGVATCDADGRILEANDAYLDMLGYSRDDLASGRIGWRELTPPEWEDASSRAVAEIQDTGRCEVFEKEYFRKDGTRVPVLMASAAIDEAPRQVVAFVLDLTARKRAEEALKRSETAAEEERDRVRRLESEREAAIANERTRLAGEIHDTLAQGLAMIVMQLADAEAKLGPEWSRAEKPLSMVRELAVESLAYARRSVNMLRPNSGAGGLARSVRDVVDSLARHFGGAMHLTVHGDGVLFDAAVESALTGIAREAITNAVKHSNATRIAVELDFAKGGAVRLAVSDDGIGFDPNAARTDAYGLISMQERAARGRVALTFVTEPGAGTTIVASWSPEKAGLVASGT
jgi:PAS domain S-box-containing protein